MRRDPLDQLLASLGVTLSATATTSARLAEIEHVVADWCAKPLECTA